MSKSYRQAHNLVSRARKAAGDPVGGVNYPTNAGGADPQGRNSRDPSGSAYRFSSTQARHAAEALEAGVPKSTVSERVGAGQDPRGDRRGT